ncbi:hypothetical protein [Streptomyces sp. NPDC051776]|uniref:hypothetical protein n=1 Tax=Streptomyces sp. NPDC051776 TaxID=3155414 RepID=UPI0034178E5D
MEQQNIAQDGRQNNTCNNPNFPNADLDAGRETSHCGNKDGSFNHKSLFKGGGARAEGGSSTSAAVVQQNIAQEGRQNNTCDNSNHEILAVTGGRESSRCGNKDLSFSKHTRIKGGGVRAEGGSSTIGDVTEQNIAQEGRQNNSCGNPDFAGTTLLGGGGESSRCGNKDHSFSKHTRIEGGGVRAEGGSSTIGDVTEQNIAQEGRQNNSCGNPDFAGTILLGGGGESSRCGNKDHSFSKHTRIEGGGVRAEGGSSTGSVVQQNIAQEGRQNNTCNNRNERFGTLTVTGGRVEGRCGNKDGSFSKQTRIEGGGVRAEGGSSTGSVVQQNIAQEGRQNNTCNNLNSDAPLSVRGSQIGTRCWDKDISFNRKTFIKGGGARAEGGSAGLDADVNQQNIAQEGRQNNLCNNPNLPPVATPLSGSRSQVGCRTVDGSTNLHTADIRGGAKAEGRLIHYRPLPAEHRSGRPAEQQL